MIEWILSFISEKWKKKTRFSSVIPEGCIQNLALTIVIAIMTFLSGITLGGVDLIQAAAKSWQNHVLSEATIQILPAEDLDMEKALKEAVNIAESFGGVANARIVSREETEKLLEPWLGAGFDINALPVPRLIVLTLHTESFPDLDGLRDTLRQNIPEAYFDDHGIWVNRLVLIAQRVINGGVLIFMLVLASMILTVVFATRSALSSNSHIVEVLHFIGADSSFIARQFDQYFFLTGLRGAALGSLGTIIVLLVISFWTSEDFSPIQGSQILVLFGNFSLGWTYLIESIILVMFVSVLTVVTCHCAIIYQLQAIDKIGRGGLGSNEQDFNGGKIF